MRSIGSSGSDARAEVESVRPPRQYFGIRHPVAPAARRLCRLSGHSVATGLVGGVACGRCWEAAVIADWQFAAEFGLPPVDGVDNEAIVDEVAVERACAGESVRLTVRERDVAARRLQGRGVSAHAVARMLGTSAEVVWRAVRAGGPADAPVQGTAAEQERAA